MTTRTLSLFFTFTLLANCATPKRAHAQFLGYTSPQTTQQTLATATNCTGAAQTFAINNIGQTQHYLSVASVTGAQKFTAEIDGIDRASNVFRISDVLQVAGGQGSVSGSGYFPQIQVVVTCSPNTATFTASYSGASSTSNATNGAYLFAQLDKTAFATAPENTTVSDTIPTPFGSSAGVLYFAYNGTAITGSTISLSCAGSGAVGLIGNLAIFQLGQTTNVQPLPIGNYPCTSITATYTTGGGGAGTITAEYVFSPPGSILPSDPCQASIAGGTGAGNGTWLVKTSNAVNAAGGSTTQIILNNIGFGSIYICGYQLSQAATAGSVQFEYGTGGTCGTGTVALTGVMPLTASQPLSYGNGGAWLFKTPALANNVCLVVTGTGAVTGVVTFVNAP